MIGGVSDVNGETASGPASEASRHVPSPARVRRPGRAAVRRRLLDAALELFAERGFAGASMDQIAEAAGLTKGAIYSNFASKDDLFFAMMQDQVLQRVEALQAVLAAGSPGADDQQALRGIGHLLTEALPEQREWRLVFLDFWQRAVRDDRVRAQYVAHRRALRSAVAQYIEQILGRPPFLGELSGDDVVTVVLALSNGLAIEQYADPGAVSDDLLGRVLSQLSR